MQTFSPEYKEELRQFRALRLSNPLKTCQWTVGKMKLSIKLRNTGLLVERRQFGVVTSVRKQAIGGQWTTELRLSC